MPATEHSRIIEFTHTVARRQAQRVVSVPGGFAVLDDRFSASYNHNKVVLTDPLVPQEALATAERTHGDAGHTHRMVMVDDDTHGTAYAPVFLGAGYHHEINLLMSNTAATPEHPVPQSINVERVDLDALRVSTTQEWQRLLPNIGGEAISQLVGRREAIVNGADEVVFLAVRDPAGRVLAHADLYVTGDIAQIEDLMTHPAHTGRGYARAIMTDALRRARDANCELTFVVADAGDWPRHFYTRLGYTPVGRTHTFIRPAPEH